MKLGSLFSGIGGFELGLERAIPGLETIWQVEKDEFCRSILEKHWPKSKIYTNIESVGAHNLDPVEIVCGGFPCQDLSIAGKMRGINHGKKSGLWWEMHRVISEIRPWIIVLENVPAITHRGSGMGDLLWSLAKLGYDVELCCISASSFGAPHRRSRWFLVAYSDQIRRNPQTNKFPISSRGIGREVFTRGQKNHPPHTNNWSRAEDKIFSGREIDNVRNFGGVPNHRKNYWERFPTQSPLCDGNDGIPNRVARLRALGNAIVPQCAQWVGEQILSGLISR